MTRVSEQVDAMREHVQPQWDDERAARLYTGIGQLKRRRTVGRAGAGLGVVAAAAMFVVWGGSLESASRTVASAAPTRVVPSVHSTPAVAAEGHKLRLADGSVAQLFGSHSELEVLDNTAGRVELALHAGRAHFDVVPNTEREFAVQAGDVRVVVIGTVFEVERTGERVRVAVQRGRVRVEAPSGVRMLETGQARLFEQAADVARAQDVADEPVEVVEEAEVTETRTGAVQRRGRKRPSVARDAGWRSLAQAGDYEGAFAALQTGSAVENSGDALMDAADAARLSGHPRAAVKYLERVNSAHSRSPVAPLAAFTLGRVLLDRLGQPHKAAKAFRRARELSPGGSLVQDALAREVEALSKAGATLEANRQAREYVRRYPQGRRLRAVQLYGGLR